jgi:CheY-like chemotaxis protein
VESLLDLSRIMAGKLDLNPQTIDLARVIEAAVDVVRPDADAKSITVDLTLPPSPLVIDADASRLQQVFWNLLSNAVKFTPQAGIVGVRCSEQDGQARTEVSDTGQGISAEFLPRVFERFSQSSGRQRPRSGLGLGLALVREIVVAHGGTVSAASPGEGRGSTFVVTLPLLLERTLRAASQSGADAHRSSDSVASLRILVVDDDRDVRDLLMLMLESRGARVQLAASAEEAFEVIDGMASDLLLADLDMPDEDGLSLIRRVRARERAQGRTPLRAIAVTAYASETDRARALAAGYDWHVSKPMDPDELLGAIAEVCGLDSA